jgi:hypothetical protein
MKHLRSHQSGFASLPVIMTLVILVIVIGISITAITLSETFIMVGQSQSSVAHAYAKVGAHDALFRIAKDKTYSCASANCYSIDLVTNGCSLNSGCARVSVSTGQGSLLDPKVITSTGQVKNNVRKLMVSVVFDASLNGKVSSTTWTELIN